MLKEPMRVMLLVTDYPDRFRPIVKDLRKAGVLCISCGMPSDVEKTLTRFSNQLYGVLVDCDLLEDMVLWLSVRLLDVECPVVFAGKAERMDPLAFAEWDRREEKQWVISPNPIRQRNFLERCYHVRDQG